MDFEVCHHGLRGMPSWTNRWTDGLTKRGRKRIAMLLFKLFGILSPKKAGRKISTTLFSTWSASLISMLKNSKRAPYFYRIDRFMDRQTDQRTKNADSDVVSQNHCHLVPQRRHTKFFGWNPKFFVWYPKFFGWNPKFRMKSEISSGIFRPGFSRWPPSRPIGRRDWPRVAIGPPWTPVCNPLSLLPLLARV